MISSQTESGESPQWYLDRYGVKFELNAAFVSYDGRHYATVLIWHNRNHITTNELWVRQRLFKTSRPSKPSINDVSTIQKCMLAERNLTFTLASIFQATYSQQLSVCTVDKRTFKMCFKKQETEHWTTRIYVHRRLSTADRPLATLNSAHDVLTVRSTAQKNSYLFNWFCVFLSRLITFTWKETGAYGVSIPPHWHRMAIGSRQITCNLMSWTISCLHYLGSCSQ